MYHISPNLILLSLFFIQTLQKRLIKLFPQIESKNLLNGLKTNFSMFAFVQRKMQQVQVSMPKPWHMFPNRDRIWQGN